jgi:hypothetical protein
MSAGAATALTAAPLFAAKAMPSCRSSSIEAVGYRRGGRRSLVRFADEDPARL